MATVPSNTVVLTTPPAMGGAGAAPAASVAAPEASVLGSDMQNHFLLHIGDGVHFNKAIYCGL